MSVLFGKNVNVVGDVSADLVLECLGNVYIKSRNKALTLNEIIKSLMSDSGESISTKTIITDNISELTNIDNGQFVYDTVSGILYINVAGDLVELINVLSGSSRYVKRSGDTMTGTLTINTSAGLPPLRVNSAILNKNLNALYLNSLPSKVFALKDKDEIIKGSWNFDGSTNFNNPAYFHQNTLYYRDSLHLGSIGTPDFSGGFAGYGWRIDGQTNTLTIDYVVVRKAMYVYELVVNKVTATNGSLWVTNSSKIEHVCLLKIVIASNEDILNAVNPEVSTNTENLDIKKAIQELDSEDGIIVTQSLSTDSWSAELMASNIDDSYSKEDYRFLGLKIVVCENRENAINLINQTYLAGNSFTFSEEDFSGNSIEVNSAFVLFDLFDLYFDSEVVFPVVHPSQNIWYTDANGKLRLQVYGDVKYIKTYHKYFGQECNSENGHVFLTNLYLVKFDSLNLPVFLPGDLLRCLKFTDKGIKYYDAVVCNKIKNSHYIILLGENIMDKTTTITYDSNLNPKVTILNNSNNKDIYDTTGHRSNDIIGTVLEGDALVLIGHLWDITRLNAVYLTSSDDGSPFIDTMAEVNRPDYSVIYNTPTFATKVFYKGAALPYTGIYYLLDNNSERSLKTALYAIAYKEDASPLTYSIALNKVPTKVTIWYKIGENIEKIDYDELYGGAYTNEQIHNILGNLIRLLELPIYNLNLINVTLGSVADIKVYIAREYGLTLDLLNDYEIFAVRTYPNEYTTLITEYESEDLVLETNESFCSEDEENTFILEVEINNSTITPTRTTKARFGKLDGIIDNRFAVDKLPHGFGLYGENVFLTGEFVLSSGKNVADFNKDFLYLLSGLEQNSIAYADLQKALQRLSEDTPSYGNLESAGIFLTPQGKLIIYGDSIQIVTTLEEFNPNDPTSSNEIPTALFANGKIKAKFLEVQQLHCLEPYYNNPSSNPIINPVTDSFEYSSITYTGDNLIFFYYPVVYLGEDSNSDPRYLTNSILTYIRKYVNGDSYCWVFCDINGKHDTTTNNSPRFVYFKNLTDDTTYAPIYGSLKPSVIDVTDDLTDHANEYLLYREFCELILNNLLRRWSLQENGVGNLGGNSLYWDETGKVTVSGRLISGEGLIGGFYLDNNSLYTKLLSHTYTENGTTSTVLSKYNPIKILSSNNSIELHSETWNSRKHRYDLNSRAIITASALQIDDNPNNPQNKVSLSTDGITWIKDGYTLGASAILFNMILVPVLGGDNIYCFYFRASSAGFIDSQSNIDKAFGELDLLWNSDGSLLISFPLLNTPQGKPTSSWIAENLNNAKLTFLVTGTNTALDSRKVFNTQVPDQPGVYKWEDSLQCYVNQDNYLLIQNKDDYNKRALIKPSIDLIVFASSDSNKFGKPAGSYNLSTNQFDPHDFRKDYEYYFNISKNSKRPRSVSTNRNQNPVETNNYLVISTADDSSLNPGGIMLTIMYNNYGISLYMSSDEGTIDYYTESQLERENRNTYYGDYNRMKIDFDNKSNYYSDPFPPELTEASAALSAYKSALDNASSWNPVSSTVINALLTANTKMSAFISKYNTDNGINN